MTQSDASPADGRSTVERFVDRLDDFDVSHAFVPPEEVTDAVGAALDPPAVGVDLPAGLGTLPDEVATDWSPSTLRRAATGVTPAAFGVADYGSLVLPSTAAGIEPVSLFADAHVAVVAERDVVPGMAAALSHVGDRARADGTSAVVATGPSATADMGALVKGAHGPKTVHAVVVRS